MADHTCNSDMVSDTRELVSVEPGGKKTYQLWRTTTCDNCGRLAGKVSLGTEEE
jgi:hypothetical protein